MMRTRDLRLVLLLAAGVTQGTGEAFIRRTTAPPLFEPGIANSGPLPRTDPEIAGLARPQVEAFVCRAEDTRSDSLVIVAMGGSWSSVASARRPVR